MPLAARDFAEMARRFPASPWTPKALLAAIASGHPAADSLRALLDARYAASPYRRAALGLPDAPAAYAAPRGFPRSRHRRRAARRGGARPRTGRGPRQPRGSPGGSAGRDTRLATRHAGGVALGAAPPVSGPSLAREVFGIRFQNPVVLAAGTAGIGREVARIIDLEALGGLVTKAISPEPRAGNPAPRVAEVRGGMLNSVGLANPGLAVFRSEYLPWLAAHLRRARVLVNVVGRTVDDFVAVVRALADEPVIAAFELNVSCPNVTAGGVEFGADETVLADLVRRARGVTDRPLVVKLSPALPDPARTATRAAEAGADGFTAVNTLPALLYEDGTSAPRLGNGTGGLSGPPPPRRRAGDAPRRRGHGQAGDRHRGRPHRARRPAVPLGRRRAGRGGDGGPRRAAGPGADRPRAGPAARRWRRLMADLVVALDLPDGASALRIADRLAGTVGWFKVGAMLYAAEGPGVVRELTARGARVFLDLKWHDIPSAVGGAVTASAQMGVSLATVHLSGGRAMIEAAARAASGRLSLVGVGVLTSLDAAAYGEVVGRPVSDLGAELERLARVGMEAGLDGAVCSPREAARLRVSLGERALLVVPGIRARR